MKKVLLTLVAILVVIVGGIAAGGRAEFIAQLIVLLSMIFGPTLVAKFKKKHPKFTIWHTFAIILIIFFAMIMVLNVCVRLGVSF